MSISRFNLLRGVVVVLTSVLLSIALTSLPFPANAHAQEITASSNALTTQAVQKTAGWYYVSFPKAHTKVDKKAFKVTCKVRYGKTLNKLQRSYRTLAKKSRTFNLASKVRVYESSWRTYERESRSAFLADLKGFFASSPYGMSFKVKSGKVVEVRYHG